MWTMSISMRAPRKPVSRLQHFGKSFHLLLVSGVLGLACAQGTVRLPGGGTGDDGGDAQDAAGGADADGDSDTDSDTDSDSDTDTDADSDTDADADAGACGAAIQSFDFNFDSQPQCDQWTNGLVSGSGCTNNSWQCGTLGGTWPSSTPSGTGCIATNLTGSYSPSECSRIQSPAIDLTPCAGVPLYLIFDMAYSNESAYSQCSDGCVVEVDSTDSTSGDNWLIVTPSPGYRSAFASPVNLPAGQYGYCGPTTAWDTYNVQIAEGDKKQAFRVGFYFESNDNTEWTGTYVDDVRLSLTPP